MKKVPGKTLQSASVTDFLMNPKSPKFRNFITSIDSVFHTGSKCHGCAYH